MMMLDDARPTTMGAITIHSWGGYKHINIGVPVSRADTDLVRALLMMMLDDARPTTMGAITIHSCVTSVTNA